jgi:hypothetical protein
VQLFNVGQLYHVGSDSRSQCHNKLSPSYTTYEYSLLLVFGSLSEREKKYSEHVCVSVIVINSTPGSGSLLCLKDSKTLPKKSSIIYHILERVIFSTFLENT